MSLFGNKPSVPRSSPGFPSSKPPERPIKPAPRKGLFEEREFVPIKELIRKARKTPSVIPGTGGKLLSRQEHSEILEKHLPYRKVGTHIKLEERKAILRNLRKEESGARSRDPGLAKKLERERKILEEDFELRGKY